MAAMSLSPDELAELHRLLQATASMDPSSAAYINIENAVAHITKTAKKKRQLQRKHVSRAQDIVALQQATTATTLPATLLNQQRNCYVCKQPYRVVPAGYPLCCEPCAAISANWRDQPLDLRGRRALVTGGRIKIGYAVALRMLRAGATVHITSRFPRSALAVYNREPDYEQWAQRLVIHGADFRDLPRLTQLLATWRDGPAFDIIINNAAQSVWQPPDYFAQLYAAEHAQPHLPQMSLGSSSDTPQTMAHFFAPSTTALATLDQTRDDSWVQTLGEISAIDIVEVQVVNAIAPFLICNELRENLRRSTFAERYIVNVTAVEGQFGHADKAIRHPHTNMAKASLNMLTRTSAKDLATEGIYMVSVDPGWMSKEGRGVRPRPTPLPLTSADAAARVLHPIIAGTTGDPIYGVLLKDFAVVPW